MPDYKVHLTPQEIRKIIAESDRENWPVCDCGSPMTPHKFGSEYWGFSREHTEYNCPECGKYLTY